MVQETTLNGVESTCRSIHQLGTDWRAVLRRYESGDLDAAMLHLELAQLARRLDLLANALWATLETEAIHVLIPLETLCRWTQAAPAGRLDARDALDALEQAALQLARSRGARRARTDRRH